LFENYYVLLYSVTYAVCSQLGGIKMSGFARLEKEVIKVGLCTNCGTCAAVCPRKAIAMNYETEVPELIKECPPRCNLCYEVCPGEDIPIPEMERMIFGRERDDPVGVAQRFVAAAAIDPLVRIAGSSGGLVPALLIFALDNGIIDAAIVAGNSFERPWQAVPAIATTREEVIDTAEDKYGAVPTNSVIRAALDKGYKNLGIVGLPCHVHGIRKMQLFGRLKRMVSSIKFIIGLCCGFNTTYKANEHIIEEMARIPLDEVKAVRVRYGAYPGLYTVFVKDGRRVQIPNVPRRAFSMALRRHRCAMCWDYSAELADLGAGNYFGREMKEGVLGVTAAIIRTDVGRRLIEDAEAAGYIQTNPIDKDNFYQSGFEIKKHGGAYHILERKKYGWAVPDYHLPLDYPIPAFRGESKYQRPL
jgi:coenzyme F420 hydrogenase subunit beta